MNDNQKAHLLELYEQSYVSYEAVEMQRNRFTEEMVEVPVTRRVFKHQKFAELIIKECANACLAATKEDSPVHLVSVAYADAVKKHFGVE